MRILFVFILFFSLTAPAQTLSVGYLPELASRMGDSLSLVEYVESKGFEKLYFTPLLLYVNKNNTDTSIRESVKLGMIGNKISFIRYSSNQSKTLSQWLAQLQSMGFKKSYSKDFGEDKYEGYELNNMALLLRYIKKEDGMLYGLYMQANTSLENMIKNYFDQEFF